MKKILIDKLPIVFCPMNQRPQLARECYGCPAYKDIIWHKDLELTDQTIGYVKCDYEN